MRHPLAWTPGEGMGGREMAREGGRYGGRERGREKLFDRGGEACILEGSINLDIEPH